MYPCARVCAVHGCIHTHACVQAYKAEVHGMLPVRGGGGETRSKISDDRLRTTLLSELQAQVLHAHMWPACGRVFVAVRTNGTGEYQAAPCE